MLEYKYFKIMDNNNSSLTSIKFTFIDTELTEDTIEDIVKELKEYEIYLEYDSKGEFRAEYKKTVSIEMIITLPSRKVPDEKDKKELEKFINKHVMDFNEYYSKIDLSKTLNDDNLAASI
ncbi:hypothetical protein [Methanobacterium oryzae]|uniref:hypothetical protein n=1 Tax=Methanobacterium oryzae TaxID=69540 RepID=UPI003D19573D